MRIEVELNLMKSILGKIWYSSTNLLRFHHDFGKVHLKLTDIWKNVETFIDSFKFYKTELIHRIILFFLLYNSSLMNYWTLVCLFLDSMHLQVLGCPKMTQRWKCSAPRADSGAKILVFMEICQKSQIDWGLGSPNPFWNFSTRITTGLKWKIFEVK